MAQEAVVHPKGERRLRGPPDFVAHMEDVLELYAEPYPEVPVIRVVLDNLNTHGMRLRMRTTRRQRLGVLPSGWSSITRPSTGVG